MCGLDDTFDVVIVGGGILGTSISYFLSALCSGRRVAVVEQAAHVAAHTSSRNTGKVHAPYLYDPDKSKLFSWAALEGFRMWEEYCAGKGLPFESDGVVEVALDSRGEAELEKYLTWGRKNGLGEHDIEVMDGPDLREIEPNIECSAALVVHRDGSTDYGALTRSLMEDSISNGTVLLLGTRMTGMSKHDVWEIELDGGRTIRTNLVINAAGGEAVDIAHGAGVAMDYTDVHFRGEYWVAPPQYRHLTKSSVYSVPEFPEYPFLDPHWIVRTDGSCQIGPNAVPVFSPYGYDDAENIREFIPKVLEMLGSGARKTIFNRRFQELAISEVQTSISKSAMIDKVRRFLPSIRSSTITVRGMAGIRSSLIDRDGRFVPDVMLEENDSAFHILNYNSPGATGVLPFAAYVADILDGLGLVSIGDRDALCGQWRFSDIISNMPRRQTPLH